MKKTLVALAISTILYSHVASADGNTVTTFSDAYQSYKSAVEAKKGTDAVIYAEQALALASDATLADEQNYYALHYNLANAHLLAEEFTAAIKEFEALQEWSEVHVGEYAFDTFSVRTEIAAIKNNSGYARGSKSKLRDQYRTFKALLRDLDDVKEENPTQAAPIYYAALSLLSNHNSSPLRFSELEDLLEEGIELASSQWQDDDVRRLHLQFLLAKVHYARNDLDDAVELFNHVAAQFDDALYYTHPWALHAHAMMVQAYSRLGEDELATRHCQLIGKMTPWDPEQDPEPIYRVNPEFPISAARVGSEGFVRFQFDIDEQGFVVNPKLIDNSGSKQFIEKSLAALEKWRYAPKFENGEPVLAQQNFVQLDFRLER